jgi:hypothetical protein
MVAPQEFWMVEVEGELVDSTRTSDKEEAVSYARQLDGRLVKYEQA